MLIDLLVFIMLQDMGSTNNSFPVEAAYKFDVFCQTTFRVLGNGYLTINKRIFFIL